MHGCCLNVLFTFLSSHLSEYNKDNNIVPMLEENNVVKMKLDTLLRLITKQSFSFPISYKDQQNILSSVLQSCLPSTDSSLRIVTDSFCFHCHQYGGFMIRCRWSSCGYMFHPICFHEIEKEKTIIEIVTTDAIVCPLHRNRIQKENGRIQLPKVVKSGYIQKAVVKKSSLLSSGASQSLSWNISPTWKSSLFFCVIGF